MAYHFVFNGPTKGEERTIAELSPPRERPILWALVGYPTAQRLELAARLTEELDPGGFVFMPGSRAERILMALSSGRSRWLDTKR